jgi:hypothetical protein
MIISDGTRTTGVDWNSLPKALYVFCDKNQLDCVQEQLSKIYRSKTCQFIGTLGPGYPSLTNTDVRAFVSYWVLS